MTPGPARAYDPDVVLDRVMVTFWKQGYEATSMRALREATGLGSRSLYEDFGNKRALFRAALGRYHQRSILPLYEPLRRSDAPLAALHDFIHRFEAMPAGDARMGCLVGLGLAEVDPVDDPELAAEVMQLAEEMRRRLADAIDACIDAGELEPTITPPELAALITTSLQGAHLAGRSQPDGALRRDALVATRKLIDAFATDDARDGGTAV